MSVLEVKDLKVAFDTPRGVVEAVNGVSFNLTAGQTLGVVGESGSGKTQTFMAVMGVMPDNARVSGQAMVDGHNLLNLSVRELNKIRGSRMAFIMQDALSALTPHMRIGDQMTEILRFHEGLGGNDAQARALEALEQVKIPESARRMRMYPHELSGGMRQRVIIAMALLCRPEILIADEPTTALDVTIQAEVMDIFDDLKRETQTTIVLITHDLGVLAGRADEVMVMYGGRIAEKSPVEAFFETPYHPYSNGLLKAIPSIDSPIDQELLSIPGHPPDLMNLPPGCPFEPRCPRRIDACKKTIPALCELEEGRHVACHVPEGR